MWVAGIHVLRPSSLLSQAINSELGWKWSSRGLELACIWDAGITGSDCICYVTILNLGNLF